MAWVDLSAAFAYGTILTSTQMQNLRDNIAAAFAKDGGAPVLANDYIVLGMMSNASVGDDEITENVGLFKVGVYTGNGTTDQGISGVGFTPSGVIVAAADDNSLASAYIITTGMGAATCLGMAGGISGQVNKIISLDADGFSVDDANADAHPNTDTESYIYIAWA